MKSELLLTIKKEEDTMLNMEQSINYFTMIAEGELLKMDELIQMYALTEKEFIKITRTRGFSSPVTFCGAEYYMKAEFDLFIANTSEKSAG
jgi:hypothetical protein